MFFLKILYPFIGGYLDLSTDRPIDHVLVTKLLFLQRGNIEGNVLLASTLAYCSLELNFIQHFCDSVLFILTTAALFYIKEHIFRILCNKHLTLESLNQPCCRGVAAFTTSWLAVNKCQVLHVCDLCFVVSLVLFPLLPVCFNCSSKGILRPSRGASHAPWKD